MYKLTTEEEVLCNQIVGCAFAVHRNLGSGMLEKIYEACFCHELYKKGIHYERQVVVPITYDGLQFEEGFRMDVFVEKKIICELKAVEQLNAVWQAQILNHLKMSNRNVGFLINFNVPIIKNGIRRYCVE